MHAFGNIFDWVFFSTVRSSNGTYSGFNSIMKDPENVYETKWRSVTTLHKIGRVIYEVVCTNCVMYARWMYSTIRLNEYTRINIQMAWPWASPGGFSTINITG